MEKQYIMDRLIETKEIKPKVYAVTVMVTQMAIQPPQQNIDTYCIKSFSLEEAYDEAKKRSKAKGRPVDEVGVSTLVQHDSLTVEDLFPYAIVEQNDKTEEKVKINDLMNKILETNDITLYLQNEYSFSSEERQLIKSKLSLK